MRAAGGKSGGITGLSLPLSGTRTTHLRQKAIYAPASQISINEKNEAILRKTALEKLDAGRSCHTLKYA